MQSLIFRKKLNQTDLKKTLRLKPLREHSTQLYLAIYNHCFCKISGALLMDEQAADSLLNDSSKHAGFVMSGGLPIGIYCLDVIEESATLLAIAIDNDYRNKGYARLALYMLEQLALCLGCVDMSIVTDKNNTPAIALYESCGYGVLGEIKD